MFFYLRILCSWGLVITFLILLDCCGDDKFIPRGNVPLGPSGGGGGGDGDDDTDNPILFTDKFIQDKFSEQYDFLWVVDNSGSMNNIHEFMSTNLTNFEHILEGRRYLDWQMAATITDNEAWHGKLLQSTAGVQVVTRNSPNRSDVWESIIKNIPKETDDTENTPHNGWEQGLESGYSAIANHHSIFSRPGVPLVLSYVSDEQDYSCDVLNDANECHGFIGVPDDILDELTFFPISRYLSQFAMLKSDFNSDVIVYSIVHLDSLKNPLYCPSDKYGYKGTRYMEVQQAMGNGASVSICRENIAESFSRVAELTANRGACFTLTKSVLKTDGMVVRVNGVEVSLSLNDGYVYKSNEGTICFSGNLIPPNGSLIQVDYWTSEN